VLQPPAQVSDAQILTVVRAHWDADLTSIVHLPVGFGAHHWRATGPAHEWFVTLDRLLPRHTAATLEAAYAGAAELAERGLEFVLAPRASAQNAYTVPLAGSAASVTPWRDGVAGDGSTTSTRAATTRGWLDRLHSAAPPAGLPRWRPLVGEGLADDLMDRTRHAWDSGPYGQRARTALRERMPQIEGWVAAYHRLAVVALERSWVSTHGEPHTRNQLDTPMGPVLVDWESLKFAPRERDLRSLAEAGHPQPDADPAMLEMFDLEWRLDEIAQYAAWFEAPHAGTEDDRIAIGGLLAELGRE
jgi:spectinomycin phosphotransferase